MWPHQINLGSAEKCTQSLWRIMEPRGLHQSQRKSEQELSFTPLHRLCRCCLTHDFPRWTLLTLMLLQDSRTHFRPTAHQHRPPQGLCYHRAMEHLSLKTQKHIGFPNQTFLFLFPLSQIISSLDALKRLQRVHFRNNFLTYKLGFFFFLQ